MLSIRRFLLTILRFFCKIKWYKGICVLLCGAAVLSGGCRHDTPAPAPTPDPVPVPDEGMRGVWLSYIELDEMLSRPDPAAAIAAVMDVCAAEGLGAVFFHLRAHADAYYPSTVWPAAAAAEAAMKSGFDPLACAVDEAHKRGIALHGWLNPYRIGKQADPDALCFEKGGVWYYPPNDPAARQSVLDGVREILERYDVDGIHFDDYFYPMGMDKAGEPFEDIPPHADVTLWRQTQVDALVSGVYGLCRQHGRVFGVSPAADIARNAADAYADVTRWMAEVGYVDYVCPQLYVGFRHQTKPFSALLEQWCALPRREGVKLYVGLALYKVGLEHDPYAGSGAAEWAQDTDVIPRQMEAAQSAADGYVLFRYGNMIEFFSAL